MKTTIVWSLAALLGLVLPASLSAEELGLVWKPGTQLHCDYRELAGTVVVDPAGPVHFWAEGNDYLLMLLVQQSEVPNLKNKAAVILKGIADVVALPGQPVQYLFWPAEGRIRTQSITFPDPTASHWRWLTGLGEG